MESIGLDLTNAGGEKSTKQTISGEKLSKSASRDGCEKDAATGEATNIIKSEVGICAIYSSAVRHSWSRWSANLWLHDEGWGW